MPREYKLYLNDIREAIEKIEQYVEGLDFEQFSNKSIVVDASLKNFIVIGEAAKNIPDEIRAKYPDVPWRAMASFRDLIAHEYFRLNLDTTWSIIQERLPILKVQMIAVLEQEDKSNPS